jgi:hypothetical protein
VAEAGKGAGVTDWLVAGPFEVEAGTDPFANDGGDGLVKLDGGALAPAPGTAVTYRRRDGSRGSCAFARMDPAHRLSEKRAADLKKPGLAGLPELAAMSGRRYLTTLCLYAVMNVPRAGFYRFDFPLTHLEDVEVRLSGLRVARSELAAPFRVTGAGGGLHPLMVVASIAACGNWETMEFPFRMSAVTDAAAEEWLARKRRRHDYETAVRLSDARTGLALDPQGAEAARWLRVAEQRAASWAARALGEHGWNGEGEAYTQHALRLVLAFAHGFRNVTGRSLTPLPNLGEAFPLYVTKTVFREDHVAMPSYGPGGGPIGVDNWARGFGFVPERCRAAALWAWNRTEAMADAGTFRNPNGLVAALDGLSAAFRFVNYPLDLREEEPANALSRAVADLKKGGFVMRNRWRDGDDCVATVFLDSDPSGGGWRGPDWGDLRLSALGADWVVRGIPWGNGVSTRRRLADGTMPDPRQHGSVVVVPELVALAREGKSARPRAPFGQATAWAFAEDGSGIVQADLSNGYAKSSDQPASGGTTREGGPPRISMARMVAVDYSGASGSPCLVAVADRMSGTEGRNVWQLCTDSVHEVASDGNSFTIAAKNGAVLKGTVVEPPGARITHEPVSFQHEVNYHGHHAQATFKRTLLGVTGGELFFVVMTVQRGNPPSVAIERPSPRAGSTGETRAAVFGPSGGGGQTVSLDEEGLRLGRFAPSSAKQAASRTDGTRR